MTSTIRGKVKIRTKTTLQAWSEILLFKWYNEEITLEIISFQIIWPRYMITTASSMLYLYLIVVLVIAAWSLKIKLGTLKIKVN